MDEWRNESNSFLRPPNNNKKESQIWFIIFFQALSGDKATLECSPPRGYPEPIVTWKKDDKEIRISDEEPRMSLHPDGNLVIESVS